MNCTKRTDPAANYPAENEGKTKVIRESQKAAKNRRLPIVVVRASRGSK